MALTANSARATAARDGFLSHPLNNDAVQYQGSIMGWVPSTGELTPYNDADDLLYVGGIGIEKKDNAADGELGTVDIRGRVLKSAAVTGYTGEAQFLTPVFATDDDTFTRTRPSADAEVIGLCFGYISSAVGHVLLLTPAEAAVLRMAGGCRERIDLCVIDLADLTTANQITARVLYGHGTIVTLGLEVLVPTTDADAAASFLLEVATVDTTGTLTVTDTAGTDDIDTKGAQITQAVSGAAAEFFDGDTLDLEVTATTAYSDGKVQVYMIVDRN